MKEKIRIILYIGSFIIFISFEIETLKLFYYLINIDFKSKYEKK